MTTQAAAVAPPAANGSAAAGAAAAAAAAVKKEASPAPPEAAKAVAAAAAGSGGTPAPDGARRSGSPGGSAAAGGDASAKGTPEAAAADAAPSKEDEEQRKMEDEILAEGQAIAGVRALLAKAFSRPAEEPAVPLGHWSFLCREMQWLANDMAQERLWKQAAAMAVAYEIARLRGKFKLRPPPEGQRRYHDELAALRAAAAKESGEKAGGRRAASKAAAADASAAAALKLDPADDPIWRDMEELSKELELPATPPTDDLGQALALTWQHDSEFQAALEAQLMQSDVERMMREEMAAREYRFEYEAALASHHMAVQEQNRRAMRLDADMADAEGLVAMDEEEGEDEMGGKKAKARKRARSGYLLDDFASVGAAPDETESAPKGGPKGPGRQFIEETYLQRKRRRERYKDVDVDYDVGMETAGRYGTRANRQMATRAGASRAQDPNKRKQQLAQEHGYGVGGGGGQGAMARHGAVRPLHPPGAVPGPVIWSKAEDDLLLAITHEFGVNWTMVSEVLSLSLSMQGIFRPPHLCKQRFRQITTPLLQQQAQQQAPPGTEVLQVDYSEDKALMALYMAMSKQQARELIVMSLPVHDDVMMRMLEALVQVGATAKQRRQLEEKRNEVRKIAEPHPSHSAVHQLVMAKTGNKHLTPMELSVQVDVAYAQQAKQHQMLAQQAQQAAQLQAQAAAAPPPPGQQAGGAAGAAAQPQGGAPGQQQQQQQAGGPSPPVQGMPAPAGAPGVAAGTPAGAPGLAAQQQQQQQQGMPSSATPPLPAGLPGQPGSAGGQAAAGMPPPGQAAPSPAGAPGQPPGPRPQQPQITLQQLNRILESGKLPNGQPLEPSMRKAIEDKKNAYLAQMAAMQQRQMMMQQQAAGGAPPGGAPGQGPSATQAALQAAQQAAAVQAGMRPAMPMGGAPMFRPGMPPGAGGMPGMQPGMPPGAGMPGQPMGMQPGLLQPQMMGAPGMGMQAMQPGMQMNAAAAAQQQAIMQQFAMQQQAQMAAAAQAQPGAQPPGA